MVSSYQIERAYVSHLIVIYALVIHFLPSKSSCSSFYLYSPSLPSLPFSPLAGLGMVDCFVHQHYAQQHQMVDLIFVQSKFGGLCMQLNERVNHDQHNRRHYIFYSLLATIIRDCSNEHFIIRFTNSHSYPMKAIVCM
jgi:hypothetical protein